MSNLYDEKKFITYTEQQYREMEKKKNKWKKKSKELAHKIEVENQKWREILENLFENDESCKQKITSIERLMFLESKLSPNDKKRDLEKLDANQISRVTSVEDIKTELTKIKQITNAISNKVDNLEKLREYNAAPNPIEMLIGGLDKKPVDLGLSQFSKAKPKEAIQLERKISSPTNDETNPTTTTTVNGPDQSKSIIFNKNRLSAFS